ncbi:MAG TPA: class I SAM-dependent methyltransferase [Bryobacteraceae bacterium]|nr:class I SAM-dependent methyltransferase [Bryobacteraceae bacterium]
MSAAALDAEAQLRSRFIRQRVTHPLAPAEKKDLTDFFHNEEADLLTCVHCGLLVRARHHSPPAGDYSADSYDQAAIERLYPDYLKAFTAKESPYRALLPPTARVIELGSHYGAFLETAANWGWKATGVDVGEDSSRFARSRGLDVRIGELKDCSFEAGACDGVFIWNCFDQIEDPRSVLQEAARILKRSGLLVVRTPNGLFYTLCQTLLRDSSLSAEAANFLIEAMAYNNLLAFPYQYGYSRATLELLIEPFGFHPEGMLNSELLTLPLPERPDWVVAQERQIRQGVDLLERSVLRSQDGELAGLWIELWFRKT